MTIKSTTDTDRYIGQAIRARRLEVNMSQEALADLLGLTFQQVQKYEKGTNRVTVSRLIDIARALKTTPAHLMPADGAKPPAPDPLAIALTTTSGRRLLKGWLQMTGRAQLAMADLATEYGRAA